MQSDGIKPIETHWNGFRFRSRLEARWAVYFDAADLKWEYEVEGFELGDGVGRYLPDFWLPQVSMFAESKPDEFSDIELQKVKKLVEHTGNGCILLIGPPNFCSYAAMFKSDQQVFITDVIISSYHNYPEKEHRFFTDTGSSGAGLGPYFVDVDGFDLEAAVFASRAARFEFGESPTPRRR